MAVIVSPANAIYFQGLIDQYENDIFESGAYLRDMERWPDGLYEDPEVKLSVFREHVMQRLSYMDIDYHYGK